MQFGSVVLDPLRYIEAEFTPLRSESLGSKLFRTWGRSRYAIVSIIYVSFTALRPRKRAVLLLACLLVFIGWSREKTYHSSNSIASQCALILSPHCSCMAIFMVRNVAGDPASGNYRFARKVMARMRTSVRLIRDIEDFVARWVANFEDM